MKKEIIKWIIISISFSITTLITILTYASWINLSNVTSSDTLTATWWNNMISNINDLNNRVNNINLNSSNIPTWAVMAFNWTTCPDWWNAADWSWDEKNTSWVNTTLDLRWEFIRGWIKDRVWFESWRNLGSWQMDEFKNHDHLSVNSTKKDVAVRNYADWWDWGSHYNSTSDFTYIYDARTGFTWWLETRPRNVALLYCIKN